MILIEQDVNRLDVWFVLSYRFIQQIVVYRSIIDGYVYFCF
jgi:hypothetical protein